MIDRIGSRILPVLAIICLVLGSTSSAGAQQYGWGWPNGLGQIVGPASQGQIVGPANQGRIVGPSTALPILPTQIPGGAYLPGGRLGGFPLQGTYPYGSPSGDYTPAHHPIRYYPLAGPNQNVLPPAAPAVAKSPVAIASPEDPAYRDRGRNDHHDFGGFGGTTYIYDGGNVVVTTNVPPILGGYYYAGYCSGPASDADCYQSLYADYSGLPQYFVSPSVVVLDSGVYPNYYTPYLPIYVPQYAVTYNQINYYVASDQSRQQVEEGGGQAQAAIAHAYGPDTYQAAFADIERAWRDSDIDLIKRHIRDTDTKISVFFQHKYAYSIASGDFVDITRDALTNLATVSFVFDHLRKSRNGDITAYGKHVYRGGTQDDTSIDQTVPFSTSGDASGESNSDKDAAPAKTVYVSYTLRHADDKWFIVATASSTEPLITADSAE